MVAGDHGVIGHPVLCHVVTERVVEHVNVIILYHPMVVSHVMVVTPRQWIVLHRIVEVRVCHFHERRFVHMVLKQIY